MLKKLSEVLKAKYGKKNELSRQLEIVKVFDLYKQELEKFFPAEQNTKPTILRNKNLIVKTTSSVMANELRLKEKEMVGEINQRMGEEVVGRVIYRF